MFKQRLLTGLILGPLFLAAVIFLNSNYVAIILGLMVTIGSWEWTRLAGVSKPLVRLLYTLLVILFLVASWYLFRDLKLLSEGNTGTSFFLISVLFWVTALLWIMKYPAGEAMTSSNIMLKCITGLLVLIPVFVAMYIFHQVSYHWFLYIMVLMWVADSGAYFAGKAWGKRKLAPKVSPGKSWEGVIGALVLGSVYAVGGVYWLGLQASPLKIEFILLSIAVIPVSILGDLFESMIKRHSGYKDSGNILPGHGGILDRIDSLTSAAPVFLWGALMLNIFPPK